ncbi:MAG: M23 family metallopeptidase [Candidatus Bipolaricaulota bacterium]|nr:M23 family metallopeptidase [Candidatus Bipolaricaulota bacterium]MDW8111440.1 M23 family metallopeptidase [Candidatus Bipolaricaulota bacterium]MDW8329739.1 M23 family metallopeptidase [Candidatus Bipolaricaulota bacterium]
MSRPKRFLPLSLLFAVLAFSGGILWHYASAPVGAQGGPSSSDEFEIIEHQIQAGETLAHIAQRFAVPVERLVSSNEPLLDDLEELEPGKTLRLVKNGVLHRVKSGQTLTDIAKTYGVSVAEIVDANGLHDRKYIYPEEELLIPNPSQTPAWRRFELAGGKKALFSWPLRGVLTSGFGPRRHPVTGRRDFHEGIDLEVPEGTEVYAARAGRVLFAGYRGGYGLSVVLQHDQGYRTVYAHLSEVFVYRGQFIEGGQRLALSGRTGNSTGPHLHFEIWRYGKALNPLALLPPL